MPLSAKYNGLINDPAFVAKFEKAVEARNAHWDALRELELEMGCEVESEDFQSYEVDDILVFLSDFDEAGELEPDSE
jgi:hypothetical protein